MKNDGRGPGFFASAFHGVPAIMTISAAAADFEGFLTLCGWVVDATAALGVAFGRRIDGIDGLLGMTMSPSETVVTISYLLALLLCLSSRACSEPTERPEDYVLAPLDRWRDVLLRHRGLAAISFLLAAAISMGGGNLFSIGLLMALLAYGAVGLLRRHHERRRFMRVEYRVRPHLRVTTFATSFFVLALFTSPLLDPRVPIGTTLFVLRLEGLGSGMPAPDWARRCTAYVWTLTVPLIVLHMHRRRIVRLMEHRLHYGVLRRRSGCIAFLLLSLLVMNAVGLLDGQGAWAMGG